MAVAHGPATLAMLQTSPFPNDTDVSPVTFDGLFDESMIADEEANRIPADSPQASGSGLFVSDDDYHPEDGYHLDDDYQPDDSYLPDDDYLPEGNFLPEDSLLHDGNSPHAHGWTPSPPSPDTIIGGTAPETAISETEELKQNARADFSFETCPYFQLSSHVRLPDYAAEIALQDYLTRPPIQRYAPNGRQIIHNGVIINIEYDAVHFKTSSVDETLARPVLHYEIAQAIQRQMTAEEKIRTDGYTVLYAVGDAQLTLLLDHLQDRADGYSSHHDPDETTKVHHEVQDPSTNTIRVETERRLAPSHYMREITDERIVMAYKALTASCIMFCVGKKERKNFSPLEKELLEKAAEDSKVSEDTIVVKTEPAGVEQNTSANVAPAKPPPKVKGRKPKKQQTPVEEWKDLRDPKTRAWKFRPYQACAIFEDNIDRDGELAADTQVFYYELPFDELPTQPPSLVRDEAYLEKGQKTRALEIAAPQSMT